MKNWNSKSEQNLSYVGSDTWYCRTFREILRSFHSCFQQCMSRV